jgi:methylmalonyl-CoA epimerase
MSLFSLDHVAIAVPALDAAVPVYRLLTGVEPSTAELVEAQGVELVFFTVDGCRIELLQPTDPESPVARFLERRGAGMHHLAFRVPDLDAAVRHFTEAGLELASPPRPGAHGHRVAFLHPRSTGGVLIELVGA